MSTLDKKNLSANNLFNTCDVDDNDSISLDELGRVLESIKPGIQLKETYCILNYFDLNKNGSIDRNEFQR